MLEQTESAISVIVPVFNGGETMRETIEHLLRQSLPPDEIIVVDDGSTDETANILRSFGSRIKVLSKTNGGPASARNVGIRASRGSLIAFTDSDCFPEEDWLQNLVKGFHSLDIAGAGGRVLSSVNGYIAEYVDLHGFMNPAYSTGENILSLVTANACFRRDALLKVNLFDERFRKPGCEDTELSVRLRSMGYKLAFVETAVVRHRHKTSVRDHLKTIANHGEGQYFHDRLWPEKTGETSNRKKIMRSAAGLGTMFRFYLSYRQQLDRRRSFVFSLLDHCQYIARFWGYRRGKQNPSFASLRSPLTREPSGLVSSAHLGGDAVFLDEPDAGI